MKWWMWFLFLVLAASCSTRLVFINDPWSWQVLASFTGMWLSYYVFFYAFSYFGLKNTITIEAIRIGRDVNDFKRLRSRLVFFCGVAVAVCLWLACLAKYLAWF